MYMEKKIANDDDDYYAKPNNARELLLTDHLIPFLMSYLKEMQSDCIEVLLHPKCAKLLKDKDVSPEELNKLEDDDAIKFKELFVGNKCSIAHKGCTKQMDNLYEILADIATKRVPVDTPGVKIDAVHGKVALIEIPEGYEIEDRTEK